MFAFIVARVIVIVVVAVLATRLLLSSFSTPLFLHSTADDVALCTVAAPH